MNSIKYDVFESIADERNARILKASNDAQLLRSLSSKSEPETEVPATRPSRNRLLSILASLVKVLKQQPA